MPEDKIQFLAPNQYKRKESETTPLENVQKSKETAQQAFPGIQHWFNQQGFLKTVTAVPSAAPKSLADSLVIYVDSLSSPTTKRLYMYSPDASSWFYVALT